MGDVSVVRNNKLIKDIVKRISQGLIVDFFEVPEEIRDNHEIVKIEREKGIRRVKSCGYDVLRNNFYVIEIVDKYVDYGSYDVRKVERKYISVLDTFDDFYSFIQGNIYQDYCLFYMYVFSSDEISRYDIDTSRIHYNRSFDENYSNILPKELNSDECTHSKEEIVKWEDMWIAKFRECTTGQGLRKLTEKYQESEKIIDVDYFFWDYMNFHGQDSFSAIMDFVASEDYPAYWLKNVIGFIYGIDLVKEKYECRNENYAVSTRKNKRSKLRSFYNACIEYGIEERKEGYYSRILQSYIVSTELLYKSGEYKGRIATSLISFFRDFDKFAEAMNNDLSDCDLIFSDDYDIDWNSYSYNEKTLFPMKSVNELDKSFQARYDSKYDLFDVVVYWRDSRGNEVFKEKRSFKYLHRLCYFFDNDLSGIDLFTCTGLLNVPTFENIKVENAILPPDLLTKFDVEQEPADKYDVITFENAVCNEEKTELILSENRPRVPYDQIDNSELNIAYISDLHIVHKINKFNLKNEQVLFLTKMIEGLFEESNPGFLLIGGDISSDFNAFVLFLDLLKKYIYDYHTYTRVVFVLGNHELWPFKGLSIEQIVEKYRCVLNAHGMYLVHNEMLCFENGEPIYISGKELLEVKKEELRNKVNRTRIIIFGGIGFSGCNEKFNADDGIYQDVITREEEINQSKEFKKIYDRVTDVLPDKNIIVLTHMSVPDWNGTYELHENYVYVNGHKHENFAYIDGLQRVYADNQVGYKLSTPRLKYFLINDSYDIFSEYDEGIHEISRRDYQDFYHGINGYVNFNRKYDKLYMLKKNGYYCFVMKSFSNELYILNGGSRERLQCNIIEYYYENMDFQIKRIKDPLGRYQKIQQQIADEVKSFGGRGKIHGAIVDIDAYCHLYVNPIDMKVTPYFAINTIDKYVYMNIPSLLKYRSPELFMNYEKLVRDESSNNALIVYGYSDTDIQKKTVPYESTDIYKVSRKLKQMQRLNNKILSTWVQDIKGMAALPENTKKNEGVGPVRVGMTLMMNCGLKATVIEDFGYKNITVQFEDGLIRRHRARDKFLSGKIGHREEKKRIKK